MSPVLGDVGVAAAPIDPYLSPGDGANASDDDLDDGCDDDEGGITTPGAARRRRRTLRWVIGRILLVRDVIFCH